MSDYQFIASTGVIIPDTSTLREQVENEFRDVFGQEIDLSPETPQGALVTMEVENRDAIARNNAELANQINPDIAGGIFLDAIWALMGGQRLSATHSFLTNVEFAGVPQTLIPKGSLAETQAGDAFETTSVLIIGNDGVTKGDMRSVETGPVGCRASELVRVASSVLGWETVNNPTDAVLGRVAESDIRTRRRRRNTLAKNTVSVGEAITSALYDIEGVESLSYRENYTDADQFIDGVPLVKHSIYVCVDGGPREEIAVALLRTKTVGAAYNGSETVEVTEPSSGQVYNVKFDRPKEITVFCRVTVRKSPFDSQTLIPDAVEKWVAGETDTDDGLAVGRDVSPFEIAAAVNTAEPRLFVLKVELSTDGVTWSTDVIPVQINAVARLRRNAVQVVIV
ncbi:baseplate J/gp47 family protein [Enterobacteriaceae bacterium YMB-R22]|uniref:baseplate J/gp47 family protein n=1 Tax=Tenebrionicola larvae TaxID=2815733 RepID=UPI002012B0C3|nr:baseplate J/gp47 family protein [Tenebrionicola larvae]MBV4413349.1 baseplate J/gp47 family protein [Tenebrionicola larvae]